MRPSNNWRFILTNKCNSNCIFCHRDGYYPGNEFLKIERLNFIIEKNEKSIRKGYSTLSGGEPFMHPEIFKIINILSKITNDLSITTNGILLHQSTYKIIDSNLKKITISLHSLNPRTYNKITGLDAVIHQEIIKSIITLNKYLKIRLNFVILNKLNTTKDELIKIFEFAHKFKVDIRFIEMDLGTINMTTDNFHKSAPSLVNDIVKITGQKLKFDLFEKEKTRWYFKLNNSDVEIYKAMCRNKLCKKCFKIYGNIVFPNGMISNCRLGTPLI